MLYQPKTVFPCHRKIHEDGFWVNLWLLAIGIGSWWILPFLPLVVGVIVSSGFCLSQTRSRPTRNPILLPHTGCPTRSLAWSPTRCPHNFQLGLPLGPPLYCLHSTQSPTLSHTGSSITLSPTRSPTQSTTRSTIRSPTWSPIQTQFPVSTRPPMNSRICSLAQTPIWSPLQGFPVTPFPKRYPTCSSPTHSSTWEPTPRFTPCWNTSLLHSGQLFNTRVAWYLSTVIGQGFKNHLQDILRIYILLI